MIVPMTKRRPVDSDGIGLKFFEYTPVIDHQHENAGLVRTQSPVNEVMIERF
jgi:hypothetical protein